jgi:hypothetical protein
VLYHIGRLLLVSETFIVRTNPHSSDNRYSANLWVGFFYNFFCGSKHLLAESHMLSTPIAGCSDRKLITEYVYFSDDCRIFENRENRQKFDIFDKCRISGNSESKQSKNSSVCRIDILEKVVYSITGFM